jgi:hypothetical protein
MRFTILTIVLVSSFVISGCGGYRMDQGSGTSGWMPLFKKEKNDRSERLDPQVGPGRVVDLSEVMNRWNEVAAGRTVSTQGTEFDFLWNEQNDFPHPTYKGGSIEAYELFAKIFIDFFEDADNLNYVKENKLQSVEIISTVGNTVGVRTSFLDLADYFATNEMVSKESRLKIREIGIRLPNNFTLTEIR